MIDAGAVEENPTGDDDDAGNTMETDEIEDLTLSQVLSQGPLPGSAESSQVTEEQAVAACAAEKAAKAAEKADAAPAPLPQ
eukprot:695704-Rhodomonas_salina.1